MQAPSGFEWNSQSIFAPCIWFCIFGSCDFTTQIARCCKNLRTLCTFCLTITLTCMNWFWQFWHKYYWESRQSKGIGLLDFPTSPTTASALLGEMQKYKNTKYKILLLPTFTQMLYLLLHYQTSASRWLNVFSLVTWNSCSCCSMTPWIW